MAMKVEKKITLTEEELKGLIRGYIKSKGVEMTDDKIRLQLMNGNKPESCLFTSVDVTFHGIT